ncbi:ComF family protein [Cohnella lupini]|uniref:ComF family protein n=1 Tax=Cohnella lupini TaxID=1294267 RepID=A0A3D9I757_9BACL|nr:ComF family protein [Cohnella lupini]RED57613.1 ComF family protein [Cohnella lupini]
MPINFRSWFAPSEAACPVCGRNAVNSSSAIPVRHPTPRRILSSLCASCLRSIPWIVHPLCRICGRMERCEDCVRRKARNYALSRCAVRYDNTMKDWLALYKYRGNEQLESVLAAVLAFAYERLTGTVTTGFQIITAVPIAPERMRDRGFNQAERLARRLAEWYGLDYETLLFRLRHTEKQSLKSRRSRVVDMRGNFAAESSGLFSTSVASTGILLIDDIYTTGSTLDECARVLRESFHMENRPDVYGLLWARS